MGMEYESISLFDGDGELGWLAPTKSTDWLWSFADYPKEKNGIKVFSCFACGGGSTMGYKLAGCEVLGCVEIDPKMNAMYVENHRPKYNYLMDIRDFNKLPDDEIPQELFDLDILDGSPPCTTFSTSGKREEGWGKKKKFREGQVEQTLDDLSFVFIETVKKIKPRVVVMENVEGLLLGEAWSYVQRIYSEFSSSGYNVKHYLCKGEHMGVPQRRHRVFFIAVRNDVNFDFSNLDMGFNFNPITYYEIECGEHPVSTMKKTEIAKKSVSGEKSLSETLMRLDSRYSHFSEKILCRSDVVPTITANGGEIWIENTGAHINDEEIVRASTFPSDYKFGRNKVKYVCGMSVPPIMIKRIVTRLIGCGIFDYKIDSGLRGGRMEEYADRAVE